MRKRLPILLLAVILMASAVTFTLTHDQPALATAYIGASTTGKFHYTDCRWANKIRADHRVYFSSREEAVNAGYVACKVCKP